MKRESLPVSEPDSAAPVLVSTAIKAMAAIRSAVFQTEALTAEHRAVLIFHLFSETIFFHSSAELKAVLDNAQRLSAGKMYLII